VDDPGERRLWILSDPSRARATAPAKAGKLAVLSAAPEFSLSAYVVYPTDAAPDVAGPALDVIRHGAAMESRSAQ
jgi:hypothetical protein